MKLIFSRLKPYYLKTIWIMILKSVGSVMDLLIPFLISYMIDDVIPSMKDTTSVVPLIFVFLEMLFVAIIGVSLNILANRDSEAVASQLTFTLRDDLFKQIINLKQSDVDEITKPSLISRMTNDSWNIYQAAASIQRIGVRAPILLIGGIAISFFLDVQMTLVMIVLLPIIVFVSMYISIRGVPLYKEIQLRNDKLTRILRENISGSLVVRALSQSENEIKRFNEANKSVTDQEIKSTTIMSFVNPAVSLLMNLGLVIVLVVGAYRVLDLDIQTGKIITFITLFTIILNAMTSITRVFIMISRANASQNRIEEVLNKDVSDKSNAIPNMNNKCVLNFEGVSFSYLGKENNLSNINFSLNKGETLGIFGKTASGKTTIINLIMKFYTDYSGSIKYYGAELKKINKNNLHKNIGVVFQNDIIFSGDLKENINFFRELSDSELVNSIDISQSQFVYLKEGDINHIINQRGTNLSGGQKQRIMIARAVANNPKLLILDDSFSALDYQTDYKLRNEINTKLKNTTKIIVTQRISSITEASKILFLDEGRVIGYGTHNELLKSNKEYKEMYDYQLNNMGGN